MADLFTLMDILESEEKLHRPTENLKPKSLVFVPSYQETLIVAVATFVVIINEDSFRCHGKPPVLACYFVGAVVLSHKNIRDIC